ncbi:MAG: hypothetical protein J7540_00525, partial [Roseofilum sp. SID2]|uniref:hypothetical protein n=1 Tax=Roseofilum sp. SID3 TaxID=2821499 RepID=UPI001B07E627
IISRAKVYSVIQGVAISFLPICILLGIDMQKKWRDRLPCIHSTIPKSFSFSESDRRGLQRFALL